MREINCKHYSIRNTRNVALTMIISFTNDMFLDVLFLRFVVPVSHPRRNSEFVTWKGLSRDDTFRDADPGLAIKTGHTSVVGLSLVPLEVGGPFASRLSGDKWDGIIGLIL